MSTRVLAGPWASPPMRWFASINAGRSAFSVQGNTPAAAVAAAAARLSAEIRAEVYDVAQAHADGHRDCDVFELDTASEAEVERRVSDECSRLAIYTPAEWDALCLRQHRTAQIGAAS